MSPFQNTYVCRLLLMLSKYFRLTNYTWMFCEGYYLHRLLANTFEEERSLGVILAIGWGEIYLLYIFWTFEKIWNYSKVYCMGCIHLLGAYLHASTVNIRRWEGDFSNHNWLHDYLVPPVHGIENCLWKYLQEKITRQLLAEKWERFRVWKRYGRCPRWTMLCPASSSCTLKRGRIWEK